MKSLALCLSTLLVSSFAGCPSLPTCDDQERNGAESDVDCGGGACGPCADDQRCASASDCLSGVCRDTANNDELCGPSSRACRCVPPTCTDGAKNSDETDADCGGSCPPCQAGQRCKVQSDCTSTVCDSATQACTTPTCDDGLSNGIEGDVDCGGDCPERCALGRSCGRDDDCVSLFCSPTTLYCEEAACDDGKQNGAESDIDCGASCPTKCVLGQRCGSSEDCQSQTCHNQGACVVNPCEDGKKNGAETDVDCGGDACGPCGNGKACVGADDCKSASCSNQQCRPPDCTNKQQDGAETGTDCGGPCSVTPFAPKPGQCENPCPKCPPGEGCLGASDCESGLCVNNVCS